MKKIYIADDNQQNFEALQRVLDEVFPDSEVSYAPGGHAIVEMTNRQKPDLILMDISMPDMDGIEATIWIRKKYSRKILPIIAMTGRDSPGDQQQVSDAGCNEYLTKPFSVSQLMEKVNFYLSESAS
jgi:CheY-like chemotaxis protein